LTTAPVILSYVEDNLKNVVAHIRSITWTEEGGGMQLDETTIKSLELVRNLQDGSMVNTLLEVLDTTVTPMGARLMRRWLLEPLTDAEAIRSRLDIVSTLFHDQHLVQKLTRHLQGIKDLDRLIARVVLEKVNPKDLVSIGTSLKRAALIKSETAGVDRLAQVTSGINELTELANLVESAIKEEPATLIHEGNIVNDGYLPELDRLKSMLTTSKEYVAGIEQKLRSEFEAPSLRIKYNKVIGYFIEVSKLQSKNLDDSFMLRQSLVNTHRYTNEELSHYESEIVTAREKINSIEEEVFQEVTQAVRNAFEAIQENARILAILDVFTSFAGVAAENHYCRPDLDDSNRLEIRGGRHPVIEKKLAVNQFIPNDCNLDTESDYIHIITGPNMSGKSTFLRQNALIVLMAQVGSYVPADNAIIGVVDRIFTRVGASDNIARGQSTFLVEMSEAANILENATSRSLIIMDEIGRGTSTYDGLSIAWAIIEYISNRKFIGAKTLFATHYHELTSLEQKKGIANLSVAVSEDGDDIVFLHKIVQKPAEKSYGIHVARLARMPDEVVLFAEGILKKLEDRAAGGDTKTPIDTGQLQLFDFEDIQSQKREKKLLQELAWLDLNRVSPLEALNILSDIQKKVKKSSK
jgi:DNA mismatch repair protein MutS